MHLIFDVSNLAWRSFFAMPALSYKNVGTEVTFGILRDISILQNKFATSNVLFAFDGGNEQRCKIYPKYKSNRSSKSLDHAQAMAHGEVRKQVDLLRLDYLPSAGFNNLFYEKGYEADDVIGSVCSQANNCIIVSEDKDLFQLLSNRVSMWMPRKKKLVTASWFREEYGIAPEQWAEMKSIAGCDGDGVPGIDGVAEKTALKYIRNELKPSYKSYKAIQNGAEIMERNRKLVKLPFPGTPVFDLKADAITREKWHALLDKLGIKRMGELSQPTFNW